MDSQIDEHDDSRDSVDGHTPIVQRPWVRIVALLYLFAWASFFVLTALVFQFKGLGVLFLICLIVNACLRAVLFLVVIPLASGSRISKILRRYDESQT